MSGLLQGAVHDRGPAKLSLMATLGAIADAADDFGFAVLSMHSIALKSRCVLRQAIRRVELLEQEGWVRVERRVLGGKANVYFIDLVKLGVELNVKAKRSPMWPEIERLLAARGAAGGGRNLRLRWGPRHAAAEVAPPATPSLFDAHSGDTMSPETASPAAHSGDTMSHEPAKSGDISAPLQVTFSPDSGDISAPELLTRLTRLDPLEQTTPVTPVPGVLGSDELVLAFPHRRPNEAGYAPSALVAARWVMNRNGIVTGARGESRELEQAIVDAITLRLNQQRGEDLEQAAELARANLEIYQRDRTARKILYAVKPVKLFRSGDWQHPRRWKYFDERTAAAAVGMARVAGPGEAEAEASRQDHAIRSFLAANADALETAAIAPTVSRRLRELVQAAKLPSQDDLDEELAELEQDLDDALMESTAPEETSAIENEARMQHEQYRGRVTQVQWDQAVSRKVLNELFRRRQIPHLELFYMAVRP